MARSIQHLTVAVLLGLAGCAGAPPASPPPSTAAIDLATRSGTWPATQHQLDTAIRRLTHECLVEHGFQPARRVPPPPPTPEDEAAVIDLPARRRHGYGLGGATPQPPRDTYYARLAPQDQKRYDTVLFGPPSDRLSVNIGGQVIGIPKQGCDADAARSIAGDLALWARILYTPDHYDSLFAEQIPQSAKYQAALTAWRTCMGHRGHHYDTPEAAQDALRDRYQQDGPTAALQQHEIAVAVADGECAAQAHLPAIALEVRRDLVAILPATDRKALADLVPHRDEAVRRAAAIIAAP